MNPVWIALAVVFIGSLVAIFAGITARKGKN
jgi:hypothetical protein